MKKNAIGYHVIRATAAERDWLVSINPAVLVVVNDFDMALSFANRLTESIIIYRHQVPHDAGLWQAMTPEAFAGELGGFSMGGLIHVQVGNEDVTSANLDAYIDWCIGLIDDTPDDARYAILPASTGNPSDHARDYDRMLPLFKAMARKPGKAILAPHSYYDRKIEAGRYLVGRYQRVFDACDAHGVPRPQVVIGEFGPAQDLDPEIGWRSSQGDHPTALRIALETFYVPDNVGIALFALRPYPPFLDFDLSNMAVINDLAESKRFMIDTQQGGGETVPVYTKVKLTSAGNNVRAQTHTDGQPVKTLRAGDVFWIDLASKPTTANGFTWWPVRLTETGVDYWLAEYQGVNKIASWELISDNRPPLGSFIFTTDELRQLADLDGEASTLLAQEADLSTQRAQVASALSTNYRSQSDIIRTALERIEGEKAT